MKKNNIKILLGASTLLSLSAIPIAGITTIKNINTTSLVNSELQDITINNNIEMRLNKNYQSLDWYGKNFASSVTEEQLKELISPNISYDVNWGVNILTPSDEALAGGYVEFIVYQIKNNFSNGVTTTPSSNSTDIADGRSAIEAPSSIKYTDETTSNINMQAYTTNTADTTTTITINGQSVEKKYVWTTKNISGLFLPYKYNFEWNDNEQIGDFLKETTKSTLTAQDVYSNMISTSKKTDILPSDTVTNTGVITFSQNTSDLTTYGISNNDAKKYGIGLVTVDFSKSTEGNKVSNWSSGAIPNEKYLVRGLVGTSSSKEEMRLNTDESTNSFLNTTFSVDAIKKQNPNFKVPSSVSNANSATTVKVSDFTPTELINALLTSTDGTSNLMSLLTTKSYLSSTTSLPALYLTYMGKTMFDTTTSSTTGSSYQWNGTGLYQMGDVPTVTNGTIDYNTKVNPANVSKITSITASSDDSTGTLYLKVTYNKYNVYQNTVEMGDTTSIIITGLQADNSNSDGNNDLYFQWKTIDELIFSNSSDIMDLYNNNQSDTNYLKSLSNTFFIGSENSYALDRTVEMSVSNSVLTITITFPTFGDSYYVDSTGTVKQGLQVSNQYTFSSSVSASSAGITFKNQSTVASTIVKKLGVSDISSVTPKEVINALSTGELSLTDFYNATSSNYAYSVLVTQNDTSDGIAVEVTATNNNNSYVFTTFYTGMAQGTSTSYIYNFAFSDSSDNELQKSLEKLKAIPIDKITVQNIYDYYVSKLPIYSGTNKIPLSISDISISKNYTSNSITVTIIVPLFNASSSSEDSERTFSTTLNGFLTVEKTNNNSNAKVKNLTIPLSVSFSLAIVIIMTGLLVHLIIKRKKLSKSKINLREVKATVVKSKK